MDKLTTLLACLPKSPFKDNLTEEIESLRQQLVSVTKERDARIAELEADQVKAQAAVKIGNYIGRTYLIAWCDSALADQVIDLLKEQAAEISRLKSHWRRLRRRILSS